MSAFLELPNGIPSHDTFGRVFSLIDAQQFQFAFYDWVLTVNEITAGQEINIDGKCLRGSDEKRLGKRAIYMVSAWAEANEIVLGQRKVEEKSNEIRAIPEWLKILSISGCIVMIDAIGTQTNIAQTIIEAKADYVLRVKKNQGNLFEDISALFAVDQKQDFKYASFDYIKTVNKGHSRIDVRECWSTSNPESDPQCASLDRLAKYCHDCLHADNWGYTNKTNSSLHLRSSLQCETYFGNGSQTLVHRKRTPLGLGCGAERRP
jgi:predicted transposase YbfD/YdcC